jgi:hypothetical protein
MLVWGTVLSAGPHAGPSPVVSQFQTETLPKIRPQTLRKQRAGESGHRFEHGTQPTAPVARHPTDHPEVVLPTQRVENSRGHAASL